MRPGDRVAYLGPNHPAFLETLFATGAVGAIFVPLNIRLAPAELSYMLADSGASVLVWAPELAESVAGARRAADRPAPDRAGRGARTSDCPTRNCWPGVDRRRSTFG